MPSKSVKKETSKAGTGISRRTVLEILIVLALLNTIVLVGVAVIGHKAYEKMEAKIAPFRPYTKVLDGNASPEEAEAVVHNLGEVMTAVVGDFLLGASNGQISAFVSNIMQKDYSSLGFDVEVWSLQMERAFASTQCSRSIIECPPDNQTQFTIYCPKDSPKPWNYVSCGYYWPPWNRPGPVKRDCDDQMCAAEYVRMVGSYVRTISRKLQQIHTLTSKDDYPAAFSNGLFQLDGLFTWLQGQTSIPAWKAAGQACVALSPKVSAVDWSGTYTDTNGAQVSWEANSDVEKVLGYVNQWCQGLSNLPDSN